MPLAVASHVEKPRRYPLVVGTAVLTPCAINPDLEQLKELGIVEADSKVDPQYLITGNRSGKDWRIISIYLKGTNNVLNPQTNKPEPIDIMAELRFLIAKDAGPLYINNNGRFSGADKKDKLGDTARLEHQGEHKLIDFIKTLGHIGYENECYIENMEALVVDGDMTEVGTMLSQCTQAGFKVRVALGVENSTYQRVNTEAFAMDNANTLTYFYSQLAKQADYSGDAYFGNYNPKSSTLQVMKATELRYFNEIEALQHADDQAKRKEAASAAMGGNRPAGTGTAPTYPSNSAPTADQEAEMYTQPGMSVGAARPSAGSAPSAPEPPIAGDDDNDLPF